jgi:hypothetical protein
VIENGRSMKSINSPHRVYARHDTVGSVEGCSGELALSMHDTAGCKYLFIYFIFILILMSESEDIQFDCVLLSNYITNHASTEVSNEVNYNKSS